MQEIIRIAKEHETAVKTKLAEIRVTQQRIYAAKIGSDQLLAAQLGVLSNVAKVSYNEASVLKFCKQDMLCLVDARNF